MRRTVNTTNTLLIWLCAFSFAGISHSQNFYDSYQTILVNTQEEFQNRKVDSLLTIVAKQDSISVAIKIAHDQSIAHYRKKAYEDAIYFGLKEIALYEKSKIASKSYIQVMYNVGRFYLKNQNYTASIGMHQKIVDANFSDDTKGRSYFEIGNSYWELGDFYKAIDNYKIGILHLEQSDNTRLLVNCYLNLSNRYEIINTPESLAAKLEILERMLAFSKTTPLPYNTKTSLYNSLASYYNNDISYDFNKSKQYLIKFRSLALKEVDSADIGTAYSNLANLYSEEKKDSALVFFERALQFQKDANDISRTYSNLANFHLSKQRWNDALEHAHKAFKTSIAEEFPINAIIEATKLAQISDKSGILFTFNYKITAFIKLFEETGDRSQLEFARKHIQIADELIDILQLEASEEDSKLYWREEASDIYSLGIYIAYLTSNSEQAFYFSEKNKALLLTDGILQNAGKLVLPKESLEKELILKRTILRLEQQYSETSENAAANKLQQQLFKAKSNYERFQDSVGQLFPKYFAKENIKELLSLNEAQASLDDETVALSYLLDESNPFLSIAFVMAITSTDVALYPLQKNQQFDEQVEKFRRDMLAPFETNAALRRFQENSFHLFQALFPSESLRAQIRSKKVLIMPDGALQQIPFEALVTSEDTLQYLIESCEMHYAYSLSFLNYNSSVSRDAANDFIGYASSSFNDKTLEPLVNTKAELKSIHNIVGGEVRFGKEATKSDFLTSINKYKVLHLATHADAGEYPWVAFQDARLKTHDLYTSSNQAELIVLSACNSSVGQIAKGEGVFSLARGFFYSGANSVIATLWNVNDKATVFLMEQFYGHLKAGKSKSAALRKAKLAYLNSNSLSDASPYYWASFVLIGDEEPIFSSSEIYRSFFLIALSILLVLGGIFFFYRKFRT